MTPIKEKEDAFFPSLDKCFSGEQQLLSWRTVFSALCDSDAALKSHALRHFLFDDASINILSHPLKPFSSPSQTTKSKFETITAAINVTPTQNGHYDINEIKEDAIWLSQETKIDEVSALRIVILEWQRRPALQLLSGFTEEEALSVQDAAGAFNLGASTFWANSSILSAPVGASAQFSTLFNARAQRQLRLLDIYLSERIHILRIHEVLIRGKTTASPQQTTSGKGKANATDTWIQEVGETIFSKQQSEWQKPVQEHDFLIQCIDALQLRLAGIEKGSRWAVPESILGSAEEKWSLCQCVEIVHILHLMFTHVDSFYKKLPPTSVVLAWFRFMGQWDFFKTIQFPFASQEFVVSLVQLLVSTMSLAILKLELALEYWETEALSPRVSRESMGSIYISDATCIREITGILFEAGSYGTSPATLAIFSWSIIAFVLKGYTDAIAGDGERQIGQDEYSAQDPQARPGPLQEAVNAFEDKSLSENPIQVLAEVSAKAGVFELITNVAEMVSSTFGTSIDEVTANQKRMLLLQLIRGSLGTGLVRYTPEVIIATIAVLMGRRQFWNWVDTSSQAQDDPVVYAFATDTDVLVPILLEEAQYRYPYETPPLLKFCSALTLGAKAVHGGMPSAAHILLGISRFTQTLPPHFQAYGLENEEEGANLIRLREDLALFTVGRTKRLFSHLRKEIAASAFTYPEDEMYIPSETVGFVVDDSKKPHTITWNYPHSALTYLVTLLSTFMVGSNCVEYATKAPTSLDNATEIIGILADLLTASVRSSKASGDEAVCSPELLEAINIGANRNHDTVSIVFAIFEQELQRQCEQPGTEGPLELLVNCTRFIYALVTVLPSRVWPWLARSRLLEIDGNGGSLATILVGTEIVVGRYEFLIGCIRIFEALVEDAVTRSVIRKGTSKAITRFGSAPTAGSGSSEKNMSNTLLIFGRTLTGIFESSLSWRFGRINEKLEIHTRLPGIFNSILKYAYGFDDTTKLSFKLTGLLAPIAEYLVDLFLSTSANDLPTNPILNAFVSGTTIPDPTILTITVQLWSQQTQAALSFSNTLIRVGMLLDRPCSHLEQQLFKATPLLARLYAIDESYKSPVALLLESLVRSAARADGEPPSLLGHLGSETAKSFLNILSTLDRPLKNEDVEIDIWNFLSAVVSSKQQWLAICLLTGTTPRESLKSKGANSSSQSRGKALFTFALDELSNIDIMKPRRTIAMLQFVTLAQNHWPWAMNDLRKHPKFISGLIKFLKALEKTDPKTETETIEKCNENRMAALISEILAMYLHSSRQMGDYAASKEIVPNLTYLMDNGVSVPSYNSSLHANLKKNFEAKYQGCSLTSFKRTQISQAEFGRDYFYDLDFAQKILGFDSSWKGQRNQGFCEEVIRANLNLSVVESQVILLRSWKLLAAELSNFVSRDSRLEEPLTKVTADCLNANAESNLPQALFGRLMLLRVDLAFALTQKLVDARVKTPEARSLLSVVWRTVRATGQDFEVAFTGEQADYYRALLRILFLSLRFHISDSEPTLEDSNRKPFGASVTTDNRLAKTVAPELLEILSEVVAKGFRSLSNQIHEDPKSCLPSDFVLLTGLLQTILRIPDMRNQRSQVALQFSNNSISRYATSLFCWSDQLAIDRDPIYGELSILFLLELSSIPVMAETLAIEGVLSRINNANLMNYYRRPNGMGPFDEPPRLFAIWARGILPLCLNLLYAVGAPLAAEVATFLNQFAPQLARAAAGLDSRVAPSVANPNAGHVTLGMASETHSLALLSFIIDQLRIAGAAAGIVATELPPLGWDKASVKEDIEGWMQARRGLRDRIMPTNEREAEWARMKPADDQSMAENRLEEKVVGELAAALECLNGNTVA